MLEVHTMDSTANPGSLFVQGFHTWRCRLILVVVWSFGMAGVNGADLAYSRDIREWREVPILPKADVVEREIWDSPPKWTPHEWFVSCTDGKVQAELKKLYAKRSGGPEF